MDKITNVVEMKKITKIFPGVIANEDVDFNLRKGEIHVLLGENGAGKTTLMNVLYGLYMQESGEIYINGKLAEMKSPSEAIANGIGMVHQHFMLVQNFTVAENIVLGDEPKKGLRVDYNAAREKVQELADKYEFKINADDIIEEMTVGQQQKVEILKALYRKAEILILDEPTAVLTPQEIDELAVILRNLTDEGKSIILITHKLKEIMIMSDRVTIIRRGRSVGTVETHDTNIDKLAELMVGRKVNLIVSKEAHESKDTILRVDDIEASDARGVKILKGISFDVKRGEIFGLAGVDGNGQTELVEVLTGLRKATKGKVLLDEVDLTKMKTNEIIEKGVSHIPEDRHKRGLILDFSLYENTILGQHKKDKFSKGQVMKYPEIKKYTRGLIEDFDIRTPSELIKAGSLSGGNQQKLIAGREISKNPDLLIAAQPTRGLDVGAIEYIHKRLIDERNRDKAVLLVSLELDEVLALSDRIGVIYDGKILGIMDAKDATERKLGVLMAGGSFEDMEKEEELYDYENAPLNIKAGRDLNKENDITKEAAKETKTSIKENINKENRESKEDTSNKDSSSKDSSSINNDEGEV